jgi:hypothetical protein
VVPIPRRWDQVWREIPQGDGGNKARFTEEITKEAVKTIVQGMPALSVNL